MERSILEKKRYFNIFEGNIIVEYEDFQKAISKYKNSLIVVDEFKCYIDPAQYPTLPINKWKLSKYLFYDEHGNKINISMNNWTLISLETVYKTGKYIEYVIGITDPDQEFRRLEHFKYRKNHFEKISNFYSYNDHDLQIVVPSVGRFTQISKFKNWKDFITGSSLYLQYE